MKKIISIINVFFLLFICILSFSYKKVMAEKLKEPTCYQQNDPRWGSHVNGDGTIASSACGILSTVNCVNYLTGNFINPVELADYAHDIGAYNIPEGGGTWRFLLYKDLKPFEDKYGFTVDFVSSDGVNITDTRLVKHLKNGGVAIGYVPGHFIAIVGYDAEEELYEIYDSAANVSKRHTYTRGTWLAVDELSYNEATGEGNANMNVSWFCLISKKDITYNTHLDGVDENYTNGKDEADFTVYKGDGYKANLPVSGYAFDSRGITDYYYTVDYLNYGTNYIYPLSPYKAINALNMYKTNYELDDERLCGFYGDINLYSLSQGMHYVQIYGKTKDGGLRSIASIRVNIESVSSSNEVVKVENNITNATGIYDIATLSNGASLKGIYTNDKAAFIKFNLNDAPLDIDASLYYESSYYSSGILCDDGSILFRINPNITSELTFSLNKNISIESIYIFSGDEYEYYKENDTACSVIEKIDNDGLVTRKEVDHLLYVDYLDSTCVTDGHDIKYCLYCGKVISSDVVNKKGHTEKDIYYNDDQHYKMCEVCHEFYDFLDHEFVYGSNKVYHWLICECGLKKDVEEHVFDSETHLCKCGYLDPNLCYHEHTSVLEKVDPTYLSTGLSEGLVCDDCGAVLVEQTEIPMLIKEAGKKKGCNKNKDNIALYICQLSAVLFVVGVLKKKKN